MAATCVAHRMGNAAIAESESSAHSLIIGTAIIGMLFSLYLMKAVAAVKLDVGTEDVGLLEKGESSWDQNERVRFARSLSHAYVGGSTHAEGCDWCVLGAE